MESGIPFRLDDSSQEQDESCRKGCKLAQPRVIPSYDLYGDQASADWSDSFNFEWIPQRSAPYQWSIQPHRHQAFVQLLHLSAGKVDFLIDGKQWHATAPCLMAIPAGHVHGFIFSPDVDGPVVTASQRRLESLASVAMPELLATLRRPWLLQLQDETRHASQLMPLFLALEQEARVHAPGHHAAGGSLLLALMIQLHRIVLELGAGDALEPPAITRQTRLVEKFRTLVDRQFRQQKSLRAYAAQLGTTPGQLSRLCREAFGMSGLDLINARLLHEAQRELIYTRLPVKQLAASLGFADDAYFSRFFRRHLGLSPTEFRSRSLAQIDR